MDEVKIELLKHIETLDEYQLRLLLSFLKSLFNLD